MTRLSPARLLSLAALALALVACVANLAWSADDKARLVFVDATRSSGIDYRNRCGAEVGSKGWITETLGAGAAWLDYDGDGHLDLYVVNGSSHDREPGQGEPNRLYRGDGKGRFRDVTAASGAGDRGWGYGVAVGDIDNDGHADLYVTNLGPNALYRNRGDGTFEDVTVRAKVGDGSWGTSAAFLDIDGDGDLDLYVCNYVGFDPRKVPRRGTRQATLISCIFKGHPVICGPIGLPEAQDVLYRNNGDGTFTDVTRASGLRLEQPRYSLGVVSGDYDNDGDQDLYVANDSVPNSLWRNRGDGTFEEAGLAALAALDIDGNPQAGMGVDLGDYDGDGWLDLVVTNFSHDLNTVYRNVSGRFFMDVSTVVGMGPTDMALSWGVGFRDFDHDADLDLFIANGHVYPGIDAWDLGTRFRQPNHLFLNSGGRFREVGAESGAGMAAVRSFRGAAFGDYDEDGDVDAVAVALDEPLLLLRNDTSGGGHYLKVRLVGTVSNRDGVGARVIVTASGRSQSRERVGGGSFLSASEPTLHFGLGAATKAGTVEVRWPAGGKQVLRDVSADQVLTVTEERPE